MGALVALERRSYIWDNRSRNRFIWNCFWNLKFVMDTMFVCVSNCVVLLSCKADLQVVEFTYIWTLGFLHQLDSLGPMQLNFKTLNTWDIRTWLSIWKVKLWKFALISKHFKSNQRHTKAWDLIPKKSINQRSN